MKKLFSAILATFFSFFVFSSAALAEWVQMGVGMNDEWGCTKYTLMNARTGEVKTERKCAQNFDNFYARMSSAKKKEALKKGLALLPDGYAEARTATYGEEWVKETALNEFFLAHTGANPS